MPYLKSGDESDDIETFYEVYRAGSTLPRPIVDPFTSCSHLDELEPAEELDWSKETVVLFSGCASPSTIFMQQVRCEELRSNYNLVTLDQRYVGRTRASYDARWDFWCAAAEIINLVDFLQIKKFHLFCTSSSGATTGLRISVLFPARLLSLTVNGAGYLREEAPERREIIGETGKILLAPGTEDQFLDTVDEMGYFVFGDRTILTTDQYDWICGMLIKRWTPSNRIGSIMVTFELNMRSATPMEGLNTLSCPVLIIRGTRDAIQPLEAATHLIEELKSVPGGARLVHIDGGAHACVFSKAAQINPVYLSFLRSTNSRILTQDLYGSIPSQEREEALRKLSDIANLPSMAKRSPKAPISFSIKNEDSVRESQRILDFSLESQGKAFKVRGEDGPDIWEDVDYDTRFAFRMSQRNAWPIGGNVTGQKVEVFVMTESETRDVRDEL